MDYLAFVIAQDDSFDHKVQCESLHYTQFELFSQYIRDSYQAHQYSDNHKYLSFVLIHKMTFLCIYDIVC